MADYEAMGSRAKHRRLGRALAAVAGAASLLTGAGSAWAASGGHGGGPSTTTTTTLPALPKVPLSITDGQNPAALLANAIALSSLGIDSSALSTAIAATQARLVADATAANKATAAAQVADRQAAAARSTAEAASDEFDDMSGAVKQAVVDLYTDGPSPLTVDPKAGAAALYAQAYAYSTLTPYGILATRREDARVREQALSRVSRAQRTADRERAKATKALRAEQDQATRLENELKAISASSATQVTADHMALAGQAAKELLSASSLQFTPKSPLPAPLATTPVALTWAFAELGKEYVWAATGPNTFDCSGLTQFVWRAAGVNIPRVAADQDAWTIPVPLSQLLPGDLVFFGSTDIHHVGIYIGDGLMINAPHTGTVVQVSSIWWSDLAGFGRVHAVKTSVPTHQTPTLAKPARPVVVAEAGPVPSQPKPPKGWKPKPGSTTPIVVNPAPPSTTTSTSTTVGPTTTTTSTVPPTTTLPAAQDPPTTIESVP